MKTQYISDISDLSKLIKTYEIPCECKELFDLEQTLPYSNDFKIEINELRFSIDKKISGTLPFGVSSIEVILTNICNFNTDNFYDDKDIIDVNDADYSFQIDLYGYNDAAEEFYACWHLDRNIKSAPPKYTHPHYHIQFGGNSMESKNVGDLLLLGSPRIPHPPMDLFLGFHFVVNNYFSTKDYPWVNKILNDNTYQDIILRAQERMWNPYFKAFCQGNTHQDFTLNKVFPLYMEQS